MIDPDLFRILGNVARGDDPRDAPQPQPSLWWRLFPWLAVARTVGPLALFLLFLLLA